MLAFIGGTGFLGLGKVKETLDVLTPYGTAVVHCVRMLDEELYFIPRHGDMHRIPPHKVNHRANVHALRKLGAKAVFATYACGVISEYKIGDLVMVRDFLGLNTPITFYDDFSGGAKHFDFSNPYDKELMDAVREIASVDRIKLGDSGVVATTVGPRYETKAEISALKKMGANLVSMTHAYEATLVNEAEIPYAALAIGTNYACGVRKKPVSHDEVIFQMEKAKGKIETIIGGLLEVVE